MFTYCYILMYYLFFFFFFNDTATTEIYTLSLHDALPSPSRTDCSRRSKVDHLEHASAEAYNRGVRLTRGVVVPLVVIMGSLRARRTTRLDRDRRVASRVCLELRADLRPGYHSDPCPARFAFCERRP